VKSRPSFIVTLRPAPGTDGIRALRNLLRDAGRRHGLRAVSACELKPPTADGADGRKQRKRAEKERPTMALGKRRSEFLPALKYDARCGTFSTTDRVQRGSEWQTEKHDVTDGFHAIFDLANVQTGWIHFPKGGAPQTALQPAGEDYGDAPTKDHKEGIRLLVKIPGDKAGVREILNTSVAFWNGIDELHDTYLASVDEHDGQLPVVELADVETHETSNGPSCTPHFRIIDWVPRPADLPKVLQPRAEPKPKASSRKNDMDDEIPF
jgi:hypothetical protein